MQSMGPRSGHEGYESEGVRLRRGVAAAGPASGGYRPEPDEGDPLFAPNRVLRFSMTRKSAAVFAAGGAAAAILLYAAGFLTAALWLDSPDRVAAAPAADTAADSIAPAPSAGGWDMIEPPTAAVPRDTPEPTPPPSPSPFSGDYATDGAGQAEAPLVVGPGAGGQPVPPPSPPASQEAATAVPPAALPTAPEPSATPSPVPPMPVPPTPTAAAPAEAPAPATTADAMYSVQLGAFRSQENADAMRVRLAEAGVEELRVETGRDGEGRTVHAVRAGRFETRDAAAAAQKQLAEKGHAGFVIGNGASSGAAQ